MQSWGLINANPCFLGDARSGEGNGFAMLALLVLTMSKCGQHRSGDTRFLGSENNRLRSSLSTLLWTLITPFARRHRLNSGLSSSRSQQSLGESPPGGSWWVRLRQREGWGPWPWRRMEQHELLHPCWKGPKKGLCQYFPAQDSRF